MDRSWERDWHLRHLDDGEWRPMCDSEGNQLVGIDGKWGVRGQKPDGSHIGCDFIRMQPGTGFPLHTHDGDHEIYFISGYGFVYINGQNISVTAGHIIHIPAEYAHSVWVPDAAIRPLIFAATGHPHHNVDAHDRMKEPTQNHSPSHKSSPAPAHRNKQSSHR